MLTDERRIKRIKDTHREKATSNKTPVLKKSTNMGMWDVGTSNQLFVRGLRLKQNFQKII